MSTKWICTLVRRSYAYYTVIRFVWVSAKFGTCTFVSVIRTLVEDKMRRFKSDCAHFSFNKCPIYTHDGASAKFSTNSHETDYSVLYDTTTSALSRLVKTCTFGRSKCVISLSEMLYYFILMKKTLATRAKGKGRAFSYLEPLLQFCVSLQARPLGYRGVQLCPSHRRRELTIMVRYFITIYCIKRWTLMFTLEVC
jgi:hypothetical protein